MIKHLLGILYVSGFICIAIFIIGEWHRSPISLPPNTEKIVTSTVDRQMQRLAEDRILAKVGKMKKSGQLPKDADLSFVCVHNKTGDVLAYLGGNSLNNDKNVDFVLVKTRDTGSILKPIFYGIALDTGAISPLDTFWDAPMKFSRLDGVSGTYSFDNFRNSYRNQALSIEDGIAYSSNVCMLQAYHRINQQKLSEKLNLLGMPLEVGEYNLNLLPVSWYPNLFEIASAYTTLANGGSRSSPRLIVNDPIRKTQVFSGESCNVVLRGMQKVLTDGTGKNAASDLAKVARAKTGSSYDSLAILQTREITMVIRVGNRSSVTDLRKAGGSLALPLLADYLRELRRSRAELVPDWE
jgi:penicillin-binding protein 1C